MKVRDPVVATDAGGVPDLCRGVAATHRRQPGSHSCAPNEDLERSAEVTSPAPTEVVDAAGRLVGHRHRGGRWPAARSSRVRRPRGRTHHGPRSRSLTDPKEDLS